MNNLKKYFELMRTNKNLRSTVIIVAGLLAILLVYIALYYPTKTYQSNEPLKLPSGLGQKVDSFKEKIKPLLTQEAQVSAKAAAPRVLRDPFKVGFDINKPVPVESSGLTEIEPVPAPKILQLQGIFEVEDRKSAIIDDKMVAEGDSVSGWVVIQIAENSVTVSRKGKTKVLYIKLGVY